MIKKQILLLLAVLLPVMASAYDALIDDIYYNLDQSARTAEVTKGDTYYSGDVVIPPSVTFKGVGYKVTSIGNAAFYNCTNLTSIVLPNSLTSIGVGAFAFCLFLTSIELPNSLTSIGNEAFISCGLTSIVIPNSVTSIGDWAFYYSSLSSVTIPNSVKSIGDWAFYNCRELTSVTSYIVEPFEINENVFSSEGEGFTSATLYVLKGMKAKYEATPAWNKFRKINETGIVIDSIYYNLDMETKKAEVTNRLGGDSDGYESYTGSVVIPPSVTYDGTTFSVTGIGDLAFCGCSSLTSVTIPNSVTSIGEAAFANSDGLTSITIPNSVTNIEADAFFYCSALKSVTIPNSLTAIGESVFEGCSGLTSITIPSSVTSIGNRAFCGCRGLISVTIPNSVKSIGEFVFNYCSSLAFITIPNSVKGIGRGAFFACSSLASVTSFIVEPFEIDEYVFFTESDTFTSATLYVPKGTKAKYNATWAWNQFQKIEELVKGDVNLDSAIDVADISTIIDVMAGSASVPSALADANGDGSVDVADISTVIDIMATK